MSASEPAVDRGTGPRIARAPGRVNLIGDHTDYTGGLVLPMTIDRWTDIKFVANPARPVVRLKSDQEPEHAVVPIEPPPSGVRPDPRSWSPAWARYVAAVVAEVRPTVGIVGRVMSTVPSGAGLSSSAALEVSLALALGAADAPVPLAQLCRRAEHRATGVPTGIMDQLAIAAGVDGHALLIDCHDLTITPVVMPDDVEIVVVYGHHRTLVGSEYADRAQQCAAAEALIGPLRLASLADADSIVDPVLRRRARHVVTENARVRAFASALAADDRRGAGELMDESHASLRDDFEASTDRIEDLVSGLRRRSGVHGVRMTGGGFGGCVVALCQPGALAGTGWVVRPVEGARLLPV